MKLETNVVRSEAHGYKASKSFSIQGDSHMFSSLIDNAYSDKIRAGVREVVTNAWDASAGNVEVLLPTYLNPVFKVRDYGPGMSHNFVMELFTSLGFSAKRETNDQVGGFGIGSKAPFAYTDTFTITCWHEGTKSIYSAYRQPDGMPALAFVHSEPSTEPSGVEIQYPVKVQDCQAFVKAAEYTFIGFDPQPRILNESVTITPPEVLYEGNGWRIVSRHHLSGPHVRMGCVIYPIRLGSIDRAFENKWYYRSSQNSIHSLPLIIDFPIGALRLQTSREELGYNEKTINILKQRINEVVDEMRDVVNTEVSKAANIVEANKIYANNSHNPMWKYVQPKFMGQYLTGEIKLDFECVYFRNFDIDYYKNNKIPGFRPRHPYSMPLTDLDNKVFVYDDKPNHALIRMMKLVKSLSNKENKNGIVWFRDDKRSYLRDLLGDDIDIRVLSDVELDQVERTKSERRKIEARFLSRYGGIEYNAKKVSIADETGVYLERHKTTFVFGEGFETSNIDSARGMLSKSCMLELFDQDDILIATADLRPRLQKHKNWKTFEEHIREKTDSIDKDIYNTVVRLEKLHDLDMFYDLLKLSDYPNDIRELLHLRNEAKQYVTDNRLKMEQLAFRFQITGETPPEPPQLELERVLTRIRRKYQILETITGRLSLSADKLLHYINAVDAASS